MVNTLLAQLINYDLYNYWFIAIYLYPTDEEKQTLYHNCLYGESWSLYSFCLQFYHHNIHWLLSSAKSVTSMDYSRNRTLEKHCLRPNCAHTALRCKYQACSNCCLVMQPGYEANRLYVHIYWLLTLGLHSGLFDLWLLVREWTSNCQKS